MSNAGKASQDSLLRTKGFLVQITASAATGGLAGGTTAATDSAGMKADGSWSRCSGGAEMIEAIETTHSAADGKQPYNTFSPGHTYISPLILEGPMTATRKDLINWVNDQMSGKAFRRDVTITPIKIDGSTAPAHHYHDCFVEEYTFPDLNVEIHDTLSEKVTIRALWHEVT